MAKKRRQRIERHQQSLGEQLEDPATYGVRTKPRPEKRRKKRAGDDSDEEEEFVPGALSNKILEVAREQQAEVDEEDARVQDGGLAGARDALTAAMHNLAGGGSDSEDEGLGDAGGDDFSDPGSGWGDDDWEAEMNAEDEAALEAFMAPGAKDKKQKTLTDVIMEKIREKQAEAGLPAATPSRYVIKLHHNRNNQSNAIDVCTAGAGNTTAPD
jgi:essential nuclear protein 1